MVLNHAKRILFLTRGQLVFLGTVFSRMLLAMWQNGPWREEAGVSKDLPLCKQNFWKKRIVQLYAGKTTWTVKAFHSHSIQNSRSFFRQDFHAWKFVRSGTLGSMNRLYSEGLVMLTRLRSPSALIEREPSQLFRVQSYFCCCPDSVSNKANDVFQWFNLWFFIMTMHRISSPSAIGVLGARLLVGTVGQTPKCGLRISPSRDGYLKLQTRSRTRMDLLYLGA